MLFSILPYQIRALHTTWMSIHLQTILNNLNFGNVHVWCNFLQKSEVFFRTHLLTLQNSAPFWFGSGGLSCPNRKCLQCPGEFNFGAKTLSLNSSVCIQFDLELFCMVWISTTYFLKQIWRSARNGWSIKHRISNLFLFFSPIIFHILNLESKT